MYTYIFTHGEFHVLSSAVEWQQSVGSLIKILKICIYICWYIYVHTANCMCFRQLWSGNNLYASHIVRTKLGVDDDEYFTVISCVPNSKYLARVIYLARESERERERERARVREKAKESAREWEKTWVSGHQHITRLSQIYETVCVTIIDNNWQYVSMCLPGRGSWACKCQPQRPQIEHNTWKHAASGRAGARAQHIHVCRDAGSNLQQGPE